MLAVGKAIRVMRAHRGMSQKDLAARADITPEFLSLVEGDRRGASLTVIGRIAEALSVPTEVLIWEAVELPDDLSQEDRRMFQVAKAIVRGIYENAQRAGHDQSTG